MVAGVHPDRVIAGAHPDRGVTVAGGRLVVTVLEPPCFGPDGAAQAYDRARAWPRQLTG